MVKTILVFSPHSDDSLVGVGGTLLKFSRRGDKVIEVIVSKGQLSQPHLKEEIVIKEREKEALNFAKEIGIKEVIFLGLNDAKLNKEITKKSIKSKIDGIIRKYKPNKIFIPCEKDPHLDHRSVNKSIMQSIKRINYKKDVLWYEVWNVVEEQLPQIYEDISKEYDKKLKMMREFKSQRHFMYVLILPIYLRSKRYGKKCKCKFAERFYKVQ